MILHIIRVHVDVDTAPLRFSNGHHPGKSNGLRFGRCSMKTCRLHPWRTWISQASLRFQIRTPTVLHLILHLHLAGNMQLWIQKRHAMVHQAWVAFPNQDHLHQGASQDLDTRSLLHVGSLANQQDWLLRDADQVKHNPTSTVWHSTVLPSRSGRSNGAHGGRGPQGLCNADTTCHPSGRGTATLQGSLRQVRHTRHTRHARRHTRHTPWRGWCPWSLTTTPHAKGLRSLTCCFLESWNSTSRDYQRTYNSCV